MKYKPRKGAIPWDVKARLKRGLGCITAEDLSRLLGVNKVTVYRWISSGKIKPEYYWGRLGFFKEQSVKKFFKKYIIPKKIPQRIPGRLKYILDFIRRKKSDPPFEHIYAIETPLYMYEFSPSGKLVGKVKRSYTVKQVCEILSKSRRQIYNYMKTGVLKPFDKYKGKWIFDAPVVMRLKHKLRQRIKERRK